MYNNPLEKASYLCALIKKKMKYLLLILGGLMACSSIATDIYLPAMPTMERELGGNAEYTITGFLIGFAVAQLVRELLVTA